MEKFQIIKKSHKMEVFFCKFYVTPTFFLLFLPESAQNYKNSKVFIYILNLKTSLNKYVFMFWHIWFKRSVLEY